MAKKKADPVTAESPMAKCSRCGHEQAAKPAKHERGFRLPRSWRDEPDGPYAGLWCPDCWKEQFVARCLTIPVVGPDGATWDEFREAIRRCWQWSTDVANWATTELAKADTPRVAGMAKLAAPPNPYLYPGIEAIAPGMDSQAKIAVLNTVTRNYNARRFDVLWLRKAALPTYRYPYPYAVDKDGWKAVLSADDERPSVRVRLDGKTWVLKLAGGFRNRRKIEGWKRIYAGEAIRREIAIEAVNVTRSDHRSGIASRSAGGGPRRTQRVMVRISAWFPRKESRNDPDRATRLVMACRTTGDAFLAYQVGPDGPERQINADHVRRWRNQHAERMRRMAHDLKYEKRWSSGQRRQMERRRRDWREKFDNRMDTWLHEVTKIVAEHAYRRRVDAVVLDLTDRSFAGSGFPWFTFKGRLREKLHERRIDIEIVGDGEDDDGDGSGEVPGMRPAAGAGVPAKARR